jgi:hypothetical protein
MNKNLDDMHNNFLIYQKVTYAYFFQNWELYCRYLKFFKQKQGSQEHTHLWNSEFVGFIESHQTVCGESLVALSSLSVSILCFL